MKNLAILLLVALCFISCNSSNKINKEVQNGQNLSITFDSKQPFAVVNKSFTLSLYGVDKFIADVSATLLFKKQYTADKIPFTISLPFSEDYANKITPKVSHKDNVQYYVHIDWDNNNDLKNNSGDIVVDFDTKFPHIDFSSKEKQVVFLKRL